MKKWMEKGKNGYLDVGQSLSPRRHCLQRHWQVGVRAECWWAGQGGQRVGRHCSLPAPRQVHTSHSLFSLELFTASLTSKQLLMDFKNCIGKIIHQKEEVC
jgi:hypothetical protein